MNKHNITIGLLLLTLLLSNGWWAYGALDTGVTLTYLKVSFEEHQTALRQALAILPVVANPRSIREEVLNAAKKHSPECEAFEKDGYIWIDRLGLKFDSNGRFISAVPSWSGE
jgi:hypothetical protein